MKAAAGSRLRKKRGSTTRGMQVQAAFAKLDANGDASDDDDEVDEAP